MNMEAFNLHILSIFFLILCYQTPNCHLSPVKEYDHIYCKKKGTNSTGFFKTAEGRKVQLVKCGIKDISLNKSRQYLDVIEINLRGNEIQEIPGNSIISASKKLVKLYLNENKIFEIDDAAFNGQSKLKLLYLSNNLLKVVRAQWFESLESILIINMADNLISAFEPSDFKWPTSVLNIYLITLKRNKISYIPPLSARNGKKHDIQNQRVIDVRENKIYCRCRKMKMMPKNIRNLTLLMKCVDFDQGTDTNYQLKKLLNFLSMHLKFPFCHKSIHTNVEGMQKNKDNNITEEKTTEFKERNFTTICYTQGDTTLKTSEKFTLNSVMTKCDLGVDGTFTTTVPSTFGLEEFGLRIGVFLVLGLLAVCFFIYKIPYFHKLLQTLKFWN